MVFRRWEEVPVNGCTTLVKTMSGASRASYRAMFPLEEGPTMCVQSLPRWRLSDRRWAACCVMLTETRHRAAACMTDAMVAEHVIPSEQGDFCGDAMLAYDTLV